eukprot:407640-Pyramimonas_sp.AAC.1
MGNCTEGPSGKVRMAAPGREGIESKFEMFGAVCLTAPGVPTGWLRAGRSSEGVCIVVVLLLARALSKPLKKSLFLVQAADRSAPTVGVKDAAKMMNCASPKNICGMHGLQTPPGARGNADPAPGGARPQERPRPGCRGARRARRRGPAGGGRGGGSRERRGERIYLRRLSPGFW